MWFTLECLSEKMIFFVGYYGFGNAGDEAILSATLAQFRARRPDVRMVVASGNPAQTIAAHGVEAVAWNDMAAIHRAVQAADLVVIGGGGLFHDYWGVDPDTFLTGRHWGVAYYAGPAVLATLYRKAVMLYAVGVGPLYSGRGIKFTRLIAESAHAITVRDRESQTVLEGIGVPASKIQVTADPAFAFEPAEAGSLQQEAGRRLRTPQAGSGRGGAALESWRSPGLLGTRAGRRARSVYSADGRHRAAGAFSGSLRGA